MQKTYTLKITAENADQIQAALEAGIFQLSERLWDEVGTAPWSVSVTDGESEVVGYAFEGEEGTYAEYTRPEMEA